MRPFETPLTHNCPVIPAPTEALGSCPSARPPVGPDWHSVLPWERPLALIHNRLAWVQEALALYPSLVLDDNQKITLPPFVKTATTLTNTQLNGTS
jgi:hypothetical protein